MLHIFCSNPPPTLTLCDGCLLQLLEVARPSSSGQVQGPLCEGIGSKAIRYSVELGFRVDQTFPCTKLHVKLFIEETKYQEFW